MRWIILVLLMIICILLVILVIGYALLVMAHEADERAERMYIAWKESEVADDE